MKVFIYRKNDSTKVCTLNDVTSVSHDKARHEIVFTDSLQCEYKFDTFKFKTTTYQN